MHALKYSAVKCPDGLIYRLVGRLEGRRNDNPLFSASSLLPRFPVRALRLCSVFQLGPQQQPIIIETKLRSHMLGFSSGVARSDGLPPYQ
jgi:hypothetical protein